MNIAKIILIFIFLLQILFYIGYVYSNNILILFSFPFIFDEEFVIMFAMFLVLFLSYLYAFENFSMLFDERVISLNKFFNDNFDQVLVSVNNLLNVFSKLLLFFQFNLVILKILTENLLILLTQIEKKQSISFVNFVKFSLYKDKFLLQFLISTRK